MNEQTLESYGITTLRISLGLILIAHSLWLKLVIFTLPGTAAFFESIGLPGITAYAVFLVEATTGIALVLGIESRWAALLAVPVMAGATWAHAANGWLFTNAGGGWEYPLFLTVATLAQALLGDGALALRRSSKLGLIHANRSPALS
ncbi:DoxX family protein [Marinobacter nanhaiticus D15-8W]|uniref:DoxX family protein n=2 Tax=Marinobacter TaxID=2742 RepID=N6WTR0_9GAMM|nr:DoxX family protein [Marinobacter nanhaiticus D15-8W]